MAGRIYPRLIDRTHHHVDNAASGRVMQKSGMRYVGTKYRMVPDCERISGDYCVYEIDSNAWKEDIKWIRNL